MRIEAHVQTPKQLVMPILCSNEENSLIETGRQGLTVDKMPRVMVNAPKCDLFQRKKTASGNTTCGDCRFSMAVG